ncbi:MAG: leucine-rich repeat domain-containing protein [Bacteroidales bacterium]|nr:leucine-rich repeat domain-containing protein [Bacteroidales bacterium]
MNNDSANYGQQSFEKRSDGTITSSGTWHFEGVDCPYQDAIVTITGTSFSFTATGTAVNPNAPEGYQTSPFTLQVQGEASNGTHTSTWSISFTTPNWPPTLQGVSLATRKTGRGITADNSGREYDFTENGIFYEITSFTSPYTVAVTVETANANSYSGDITIPSSVTHNEKNYLVTAIGEYAFAASTNLSSVTIPSSVTEIGDGAFWACTNLSTISIPSSVDSIGKTVFYGCTSLNGISVDAANSTFSSEDGILYNKDKTTLLVYPAGKPGTSYTISSSVDTIASHAFGYCKGLTSIVIPNTVTFITGNAFSECTGLTTMTIPSSVSYLINNPFYVCTGLTSIYVDPANLYNTSVDGVLYKKNLQTIICYPPSKPGNSYVIPSSVTYVRSGAFMNCTGLKTVSIPSSVTTIRSEVFSGCTNLTSIYAYPTTPVDLSSAYESSNDVFTGVDTINCVLHVPAGSKDLYAAAVQWKAFVNIVEDADAGINNPSLSDVQVSVQSGQMLISGATVGETITLYSLQGAILYSQKADSPIVKINLPAHGAYTVKVGEKSVKVVY